MDWNLRNPVLSGGLEFEINRAKFQCRIMCLRHHVWTVSLPLPKHVVSFSSFQPDRAFRKVAGLHLNAALKYGHTAIRGSAIIPKIMVIKLNAPIMIRNSPHGRCTSERPR